MPKVRVLVVDDAVVIRKILSDVLSADDEIEVIGTAANGRIALQKIEQLNPDIITLDVEMPEMNGLETIPHIRKDHPKLPIIMFSTLTQRGGEATLEALSLGATDYVTKPANVGSVTNAKEAVKSELISKIKALAMRSGLSIPVAKPATNGAPVPTQAKLIAGPRTSPFEAVVIGVSTGGPNALAAILPTIPKNFPVPILIVQHMPPMFTTLLAERLDTQSNLKVLEAQAHMKLEPGTAYLAPGDYHLETLRMGHDVMTRITQGPKENSCRPAVDTLFRSVVPVYKNNVLAVILTGMGKDGFLGCQLIAEAGGEIIAQDKASSVVWGMPSYVVEAGLAQAVLPLDQIGFEITRRVAESFSLDSKLEERA